MLIGSNSNNSIVTQTASGIDIQNYQTFEITTFESNQFNQLERQYQPPFVIFKSQNPIPIYYNCHGMTFASRRTGIHESEEVQKILREDGYKEINEPDTLPGDVVIYLGTDGDIEHSGIVVSSAERNPTYIPPRICSKWGKYKEAVHSVYNCPYSKERIKYYRLFGNF